MSLASTLAPTLVPCGDHDLLYPRLDGSCNNLDQLEFGMSQRPMGGVLFGTHERQYVCNPSRGPEVCSGDPEVCEIDRVLGRGWSCGYYNPLTDETRELPLERDVHRYIHQSESVRMYTEGKTTPDQDELNYLFMGWANMFLGHEGQATKGILAATAPVGSPECGDLCGGYSSQPDQRFYLTDVEGQSFIDTTCDAYNATNCADEILYENFSLPPFGVFKGLEKRYPPTFLFPTPYPGELLVPSQSLIKHEQTEVVEGDNKKASTSMASAWMHLHTIYSSNITRFNEIKAADFDTSGELASRTVDSMDGVFGAQSDDRTSYCDLTETVYTDENTTTGALSYSSPGVCWTQGLVDNPSMTDPYCYSTGGHGAPVLWWIIDMDTAAGTCLSECDAELASVSIHVGGTCMKEDRVLGDCSPHNVIRAHCDEVAARHSLAKADYVTSYTAGLLPNTVIHDFPITATDAGISFNGDFFRDYHHPSETIVMGDERAHANAPLSFWQILYFREHNALAREIKDKACDDCHGHGHKGDKWMAPCEEYYNSETDTWNGQRIFDDARMINIGQAQHHYKLIMERITGHRFKYNKWHSYDDSLDARMPMENAMANRGHTMVAHNMHAKDSCGTDVTRFNAGGGNGRNAHDWHSVHQYFAAGKVDNMLYGLASKAMPAMDHLSEMFLNLPGIFTLRTGINIPSFTLIRSRDGNVGTYGEVWEAYYGKSFQESTGCGDPTGLECFEALAVMIDDVPGRLQALYGDVNLVDLWTGYVSEPKGDNGSIFGRLQTEAVVRHTENLIYGDRFWYENANQHNHHVRRKMKKLNIRDLILKHADDADIVDEVLPRDIFDSELDFFDEEPEVTCANTVVYMPGEGVSV